MMTLEEAQHQVDCWIKKYGVRYFSELTNMAVLTEEVGELARVMSRKYGDQSFKEGEKDNLEDEMAEMIIRASVGEGDTIVVDFDKDKQEIVTNVKKSEPAAES